MHNQLVTLQRESKLEVTSYDPFKKRLVKCCNYQVKKNTLAWKHEYSHTLIIICKNIFKKVFVVIPFDIKQLELTLNVIKS